MELIIKCCFLVLLLIGLSMAFDFEWIEEVNKLFEIGGKNERQNTYC